MFDIIWAMLVTLRLFIPGREKNEVLRITVRVVEQLIRVLIQFERNSPEFLHTNIIKTSLELIVATTEYHNFNMELLFQLIRDALQSSSKAVKRCYHGNSLTIGTSKLAGQPRTKSSA